ncbi:MAG: hypothetical protein CMH50_02600, partial [Myxococcales bacterium]|nr:hypothetical protein [Myxococcales bacterium]
MKRILPIFIAFVCACPSEQVVVREVPNECGNGEVEADEECDDGNTVASDDCT